MISPGDTIRTRLGKGINKISMSALFAVYKYFVPSFMHLQIAGQGAEDDCTH